MPVYEFKCKPCGASYEVTATVKEKETGLTTHCPKCGSAAATQVFSGFMLGKGAKAGRPRKGCGCGPGSSCG